MREPPPALPRLPSLLLMTVEPSLWAALHRLGYTIACDTAPPIHQPSLQCVESWQGSSCTEPCLPKIGSPPRGWVITCHRLQQQTRDMASSSESAAPDRSVALPWMVILCDDHH